MKSATSNFTEIYPVGAMMMHMADTMKLTTMFHDDANAPNTRVFEAHKA
jgi:hypothetical protein